MTEKDRVNNQNEMKKEIEQVKEAIQILAKHMDEKNKAGILNKLFR